MKSAYDAAVEALARGNARPRVYSTNELKLMPWGHGWLEVRVFTSIPRTMSVTECVWLGERVYTENGPSSLQTVRGKRPLVGKRMWTARPDREDLETTPWEDVVDA